MNARLIALSLAALAALFVTPRAHAQTVTQMPPGTQLVQLPDGTYMLILPDGSNVPPSYAQPQPPPMAPPLPTAPSPAATAGAYAQSYQPYGIYDRPPGIAPYAQDRLARADGRLRRERRSLIAGTVGLGGFSLGVLMLIGSSFGGYDSYGYYDSGYSRSGSGRAGIALAVLGGGSAFGGLWTSSIVGIRTSRDLQALGAPSARGLAISSTISMALFETGPLAVPLGWAHYAVARRRYAALSGQRYRAGLELSLRPIVDPTTGMRGVAIGGSF